MSGRNIIGAGALAGTVTRDSLANVAGRARSGLLVLAALVCIFAMIIGQQLVLANVFGSELIRRGFKVLGEIGQTTDVRTLRVG
jgi:hypothetical protein